MQVSTRSRWQFGVFFLVLGAGIPGCGDDGGGSASDATATGTATTPGTATDATGSGNATSGAPTTGGGSESGTEGSSGSTGATGSSGSPTTGDASTGTTTGVGPSTGPDTTSSTGDDSTTGTSSTSEGPKLDMGIPVCPPDNTPATFDYIWIANTSQATVSKINTMTGVEEGRYYVSPTPNVGQSSRTSVNQWGDVAVSNRDPASVTKVAAVLERCVDKNGNGVIDTSTGPNDVRPWGQDECVLWHTSLPLAAGFYGGARPTAWEGVAQDPVTCEMPTPRLWIGYKDAQGTAHFVRLHGDTGEILDEATWPGWTSNSFGPYGGAVNTEGDFFVIGYDNEISVRVDAITLEVENLGFSPGNYKYGMGVDQYGRMWVGSFSGPHHMYHYDPQTKQWEGMGNGGNPAGGALGVAVDDQNRVWGAANGPCRLIELDGNTKTWSNQNIALPGCSSPWGVSIDNEGYVWVVDKANKAYKVDPDTYEVKLIVTGLINPYTYSDMTGQGLKLVLPQ